LVRRPSLLQRIPSSPLPLRLPHHVNLKWYVLFLLPANHQAL
jgi:hypothetical protein